MKLEPLVATVRRARVQGYRGKQRLPKGNVYLNKIWLGSKVVILLRKEFLEMKRELRGLRVRAKVARRMFKSYEDEPIIKTT